MRAIVLDDVEVKLRDWPEPEPGPGEALVRVTKAGICGSDVHLAVERSVPVAYMPIVLGHEPAGIVEALGEEAEGPAVGTRVAVLPLVSCGSCRQCEAGRATVCAQLKIIGIQRDGCWADLLVVAARNLVPIPDGVSDELAAPAVDGMATAYRAVLHRGRLMPGERVAVWGAGGLGSAAIAIARASGAESITAIDQDATARTRALQLGADRVLDGDGAARLLREDGGVDLSLEFVGLDATITGATTCLDRGGRAVIVGINKGRIDAGPIMPFVNAEREVLASFGASRDDVVSVLGLLAAGTLSLPNYVGDVLPLEQAPRALQLLSEGRTNGARVVLDLVG